MMSLQSLLRNLNDILREQVYGGSVLVYSNDISIILTEMEHLQGVSETIKVYET